MLTQEDLGILYLKTQSDTNISGNFHGRQIFGHAISLQSELDKSCENIAQNGRNLNVSCSDLILKFKFLEEPKKWRLVCE